MLKITLRRPLGLILICLAYALAFACGGSTNHAAAPQPHQALWFSDLHFNPFADPAIVPDLAAQDASQWPTLLAGSPIHSQKPGTGQESNQWLLEQSLTQMRAQLPQPDFIIFTGDFLSHWFNETYAEVTGDTSEAGLHAFIDKTLTHISSRFDYYYPNTPVYFCLGNNDSYAGDYLESAGSPFLTASAQILGPRLLKDEGNLQLLFATYPQGGYFEADLAGTGGRILSLDANFLSVHAPQTAEASAETQLDWLASRLSDAAGHGDKVWVLLHIPPGVDVYATLAANNGEEVPPTVVSLMRENHLARLKGLFIEYASTIPAVLAGHIHRDDFRLLLADDGHGASVLVIPSISPVYANNPTYKVLDYSPDTFAIQDCATWYLDGHDGEWKLGQRFSQAYGVEMLNAASLHQLWLDLRTDTSLQTEYALAYNGFRGVDEIGADFRYYWAAMGAMEADGFRNALSDWAGGADTAPAAWLWSESTSHQPAVSPLSVQLWMVDGSAGAAPGMR
ncbi:MAG: metallophosphoesterase [Desulfobacteraceae bacterium]|nr:metallophosphoesterase [Desulfobacteraceae bacterium]